ncbi:hypothetical protein LIER_37687 [Lithospermum erythrorhizon]|uniref:Uncharacterized protein n=1 Tax=Lithospermum erythrorhizon TaxID=34254 RepID=A0AAV3PT43_LITER
MLKYFLGVEVIRSKKDIFLSQRKYVMDLLTETGKLGAKPCSAPMAPGVQLTRDGKLFDNPERYRRLVGKLNYLRVTRPDITFAISKEIGIEASIPAKLWCDNHATIHIASNSVFHERTKHIEVDCHFVRDKVRDGLIATGYMKSEDQLGDLFTKALTGIRMDYLCNKLGMINIYDSA